MVRICPRVCLLRQEGRGRKSTFKMFSIPEDMYHTVIHSARHTVFSFFLPSANKLITSDFSLEVLLARNVTVLRGALDSHYATDG